MRSKAFDRKVLNGKLGPGGIKCQCCGGPRCMRVHAVRVNRKRLTRLLNVMESEWGDHAE